ncbi:TetR/AcrR family transcriptional regulator [Streptomyces roseicoloratus]|uniref:TetR/AcrR family transcriptional regulator C-terminal ligand-binding domain-containing protein n=1 Tax=Streptomyces roseicoloratus TaxID=2508722 RepID=A0ABY9RQ42_9ACTN|nr:TetR/AcrR family transcriptional regulator [Streptomyces roseicoloratus]WMX44042.1 TetR/AcrR family transcriptional regulator C-terminal ligand-binding domain-containing protein [Streptomyces roseicoloratus]
MSTQAATAAARRSKLTPEREAELYEAVICLLREGGYDSVTMEGVAARTKCGKATLYRQWGTKPRLVTAALDKRRRTVFTGIDTGSLVGDLREAARIAASRRERDAELMEAVSQAYIQHPDLRAALRETVIEPEVAAIDAMLRRAVERGEIAAGNPAIGFVAPCFLGMLRIERLFEERFTDEATMRTFVDAVLLPALRVDAPDRETTGD